MMAGGVRDVLSYGNAARELARHVWAPFGFLRPPCLPPLVPLRLARSSRRARVLLTIQLLVVYSPRRPTKRAVSIDSPL